MPALTAQVRGLPTLGHSFGGFFFWFPMTWDVLVCFAKQLNWTYRPATVSRFGEDR